MIENTPWTATGIITSTFTSSVWIKSVSTIWVMLIQLIIVWNELLLAFVVILYFIDLILGLVVALKDREFNLPTLWRGAFKILIYWIFILIWTALDEWLQFLAVFSSIMFWFILTTDSLSILKKIRDLWFNTPMFIEKYLISYKNKLDENLKDK